MLADILPTGYEVGVLNGRVAPGDVVAVVGAGPIGLAAIIAARLFRRRTIVAIDLADGRLEAAKQFGADVTVNSGREDARDHILSSPRDSERTLRSRRSEYRRRSSCARDWSVPAAASPTSGVHGTPATLHLEELWIRDVTITTGLVDTYSTPTLLKLVRDWTTRRRQVRDPPLPDRTSSSRRTTSSPAPDETGALKVVLTRE